MVTNYTPTCEDNFEWTETFWHVGDRWSDCRGTAWRISMFVPAVILGFVEMFINIGACFLNTCCPCLGSRQVSRIDDTLRPGFSGIILPTPKGTRQSPFIMIEEQEPFDLIKDFEIAINDLCKMVSQSTLRSFLELNPDIWDLYDLIGQSEEKRKELVEKYDLELDEVEKLNQLLDQPPQAARRFLMEIDFDPMQAEVGHPFIELQRFSETASLEELLQALNPSLLSEIQADPEASQILLGNACSSEVREYLESHRELLQKLMVMDQYTPESWPLLKSYFQE